MSTAAQYISRASQARATPQFARRAIGLLDLTSLNDDDTPETIATLCQRAVTPVGPVAAVCIYPRFVTQAHEALLGSGIKVATVVNFPAGDADLASVCTDTINALDAGADEIDVVLPYRRYLKGQQAEAMAVVEQVCIVCRERARVKLILETGRLVKPEIILAASREAIAAGVDFLKTSTGKVEANASLEACAVMLQAIREHADRGPDSRTIGLKPSGGIRDSVDAAQYVALADIIMGEGWATPHTFRFGASSLLDALLKTLGHDVDNLGDGGY